MKVLVPVDGSKYSAEALKIAIDYAKTKGANINIISVAPVIEGIDLEISASKKEKLNEIFIQQTDYILQQASTTLAAENITATCKNIVTSVSVADAILDFAEKENIDLIIIGSHGLGKSSRFKMGSVASKVVKHSPCSVYVVKLPE